MVAADAPPDSSPSMPPAPASTVACLRDADPGLEVLLLRRNSKLVFHGGAWVFPGGRVDPGDAPGTAPHELPAARAAAVRETREEAGLALSPDSLVPFSHWTTPPGKPRRFATWFFLNPAPAQAEILVDGQEIAAYRWMTPAAALRSQAQGEIALPPPTFVTLVWLAEHACAATALEAARQAVPTRFVPRPVTTHDGVVSLYEGDAGYATREVDRPGARHRLLMGTGPWTYLRRLSPPK